MSRHTSFQFRGEREGRVAQMSRQEEVIARKRQELLEKKRTNELAKQVVAAQAGGAEATEASNETAADAVKHPSNLPQQTSQLFAPDPPPPKNSFTNDGSFFESFRKITEAAKKAEEDRQKVEAERLAKEKELEQQQAQIEQAEHMIPPMPIPSLDSAYSTNSMNIGPPMKDPNMFAQNIPSFINLAAPPPPPPPPPVAMPSHQMGGNPHQMNHLPPPQAAPPPPPFHVGPPPPPPNVQQHPPPTMTAPPPFPGAGPPNMHQQPPMQPPFEGNNYLNESQMNRNCGNIEQMDENPRQSNQSNSLPPMNTDLNTTNTTANIAAAKSTIPTTIDGLIEFIAVNGDEYEEKILTEIAQMNERTLFRFLNDKDSENYKMYRNKVIGYRVNKLGQSAGIDDSEKYDPEDILREDENDMEHADNMALQMTMNQPGHSQTQSVNSDEYDSDSEYMQESMKRNLKNMKRRIDSGNTKKRYAETTTSYSSDGDHTDEDDHMEMYRKIQMRESAFSDNQDVAESASKQDSNFDRRENSYGNRKKRSRWGEQVEMKQQQHQQQIVAASGSNQPFMGNRPAPSLLGVTRTDPALLNYARQNYGTTDLTEEDWAKCEEHFKVNLLYQDMLRKRDELDRLAKSGRHKYEYDSDEDVTGGTWEHKIRNAEMEATAAWADALTKQSEGKHHIGDFLPPEELKKFMEIYKSKQTNREPDLSDYKEYKLKEDNKGFQMLQKLGWTEGQGLGIDGGGIINPVNKATQRDSNQGLGTASNTTPEAGDNEYDAYRKRMMLAYRFRPNPLNNPRRAYY